MSQITCRRCGREIVFVLSGNPNTGVHYSAHHRGVNLHDRDLFEAGARFEEPSASTQARLRRHLEAACAADDLSY